MKNPRIRKGAHTHIPYWFGFPFNKILIDSEWLPSFTKDFSLPLSLSPSLSSPCYSFPYFLYGRERGKEAAHAHTHPFLNNEAEERRGKGKGGREGGRADAKALNT